MKFNEKLNYLMNELKISNASLSKVSNIDPSLISRLRNGERIPSYGSDQIKNISKGLELIIKKENKKIKVLGNKKVIDYLQNSDLKKERKNREIKTSKDEVIRLIKFNDKFNLLMNELNISNIKLAKAVNIDTSLISRYRSGSRIPSSKNSFVEEIIDYFSKYDLNKLAIILNISDNNITKDQVKASLKDWFYEDLNTESNTIERFLSTIDSFNYETGLISLSKEMLNTSEGVIQNREVYYNNNGLRDSIIRFFSSIAKETDSKEICMYSDEPITWLTEDKNFTKKWAMLMFYLLNRKNKINIIHNINRNVDEILNEIENWIPFYMTGNVMPYYFKNNSDNHFSNTIMVAKNTSSIYSSHVNNSNTDIPYYYSEEKNDTNNLMIQFNNLLDYCNPLIIQYSKDNKEKFINRISDFELKEGKTKNLVSTLPIYTMPFSLLKNILEKNNIDDKDKLLIENYYHNRVNSFNECLANNKHIDYCQTNSLKNQKLIVDIPEFLSKKTIFYDEKDLIEHIKNIENITKKNSNYTFKSIKENGLKNITIIQKENEGVFLIKLENPSIALEINHSIICNAIENYIDSKK